MSRGNLLLDQIILSFYKLNFDVLKFEKRSQGAVQLKPVCLAA